MSVQQWRENAATSCWYLLDERLRDLKSQLPRVWQKNHTLLDTERWPKQFPVQIQLQPPLNTHFLLTTRWGGGGVKNTEGEGWELLLDAAMLKNIMHTFPSRSLLGNTDTVWFLVSGWAEWEQHSAAPWLHCGCVGWTGCVCSDFEVPTVSCEVKKMLAPAGPDHEAQNNTTNCYCLGSQVQWVSLL